MDLPLGLALVCTLCGSNPSGTPVTAALNFPREAYPSPAVPDLRLKLSDLTDARVTKGLLIGSAAVLIVSELLILADRADGDGPKPPTISKILTGWGRSQTVLPYTVGAIAGHVWWTGPRWDEDKEANAKGYILASTALLLLVWDIKAAKAGEQPWEASIRRRSGLFLGLGILAGHFLWRQKVIP